MEFQVGDIVEVLLAGDPVAEGKIDSTDTSKAIHNGTVGADHVHLWVTKALVNGISYRGMKLELHMPIVWHRFALRHLIRANKPQRKEDVILKDAMEDRIGTSEDAAGSIIGETVDHIEGQENVDPQQTQKRQYTFVTRKRAPENLTKRSRRESKVSEESILSVLAVDCCSKRCAQTTNRDAVQKAREYYLKLDFARKKEFVDHCFSQAVQDGKLGFGLVFDKRVVCPKAWYTIYGISKSTFYRDKNNSARHREHGNIGLCKTRSHTVAASQILREVVQANAEGTSIDGQRKTQQILPAAYTQESLRAKVNTTLKQMGLENEISRSAFNRMWNTEFKDVVISK